MEGPGRRRLDPATFGEKAVAVREYILALPKEQVQGKPWAVLDAIDEFARTQGLPLIFRQNKLKISREVLDGMQPKPKVVVEFGTYVGNSAIGWGAMLREYHGGGGGGGGSSSGPHVYAFELDPKQAQVARDLVEVAGLADVVTVLDGAGSDSLRRLHAEGKVAAGQVDVVFLDHWKDVYLPDLRLVEEFDLLRQGSVVLADNTDFPGAPDYVEYVQKGGSGESGAPRYETESLEAPGQDRGAKIVMVSKVVGITS